MELIKNETYLKDLSQIANLHIDWSKLADKSILITGATGMVGSFLVDLLMYRNVNVGQHCTIYAVGRNVKKAYDRFHQYWDSTYFHFFEQDINKALQIDIDTVDYVLHAASNTHPVAYATDPIGTITANVIGTYNLLQFASSHHTRRFVFLSSVEIYGENQGDCDKFSEKYCGYIDCNTLRAGYPESKRVGEALCQAFKSQMDMNIVIPRLSRIYGPTMLKSDTKAISQFIKNGIEGKDIILKSAGTQMYSYSYVADAVSGVIFAMLHGKNGEAYNITGLESDISLRDLAQIIADYSGKRVLFELPDEVETLGYSKATKATLNIEKIRAAGWAPSFSMRTGLEHTISILRNLCAES